MLYNIRTVMLDHNKLVYIHPSIGRLSNLTKLSLSHNCIDELPVGMHVFVKTSCLGCHWFCLLMIFSCML